VVAADLDGIEEKADDGEQGGDTPAERVPPAAVKVDAGSTG
jgi:hypothetical protein